MNKVLTTLKKEGREIEVYDSIQNARLEGETYEQYTLRRKVNEMRPKRTRDIVHISSFLIPQLDENGKVVFGKDGNPIFIGKSKGKTYVKENKAKKEEHMKILEQFKEKAREEKIKKDGK